MNWHQFRSRCIYVMTELPYQWIANKTKCTRNRTRRRQILSDIFIQGNNDQRFYIFNIIFFPSPFSSFISFALSFIRFCILVLLKICICLDTFIILWWNVLNVYKQLGLFVLTGAWTVVVHLMEIYPVTNLKICELIWFTQLEQKCFSFNSYALALIPAEYSVCFNKQNVANGFFFCILYEMNLS